MDWIGDDIINDTFFWILKHPHLPKLSLDAPVFTDEEILDWARQLRTAQVKLGFCATLSEKLDWPGLSWIFETAGTTANKNKLLSLFILS